MQAIGCDGTNTNTEHKGGIVTLLEKHLNKPLQWFICQLHGNELPLRHLLSHLDGQTTGPRALSGPIGKALQQCEKLPVVKFNRINSTLPDIPSRDLSTDQKYMYDICQAIITGTCSENLSKRDPGKLNHSRWLTTANRVLRLYVASINPSANLVTLATFITKVYVPMWFDIKLHPSCIYGAQHIFKTIKLCEYLSNELKTIVHDVIQRNGYFGHMENLLLCMLWDDRKQIRELAYRKIIKARNNKMNIGIREFVVPKFNFSATDYIELLDWQNIDYYEPPVTTDLSEDQLKEIVHEPESSIISYIQKIPCHTQAVERAVKLVSEASLAVCDSNRRDGMIRSKLDSRAIMPKFENKKDFNVE